MSASHNHPPAANIEIALFWCSSATVLVEARKCWNVAESDPTGDDWLCLLYVSQLYELTHLSHTFPAPSSAWTSLLPNASLHGPPPLPLASFLPSLSLPLLNE
ncbi:hypothetical protein AYX15_07066 [Cryptococcus neoformans]|nr:hypothetical protein AYX15_07066 [Cryptococcus neoformans var. grubii]